MGGVMGRFTHGWLTGSLSCTEAELIAAAGQRIVSLGAQLAAQHTVDAAMPTSTQYELVFSMLQEDASKQAVTITERGAVD